MTAPKRIWMDPDIRFPECEKQYGCDVEYIRADLVAELVQAAEELDRTETGWNKLRAALRNIKEGTTDA
jgi:hypothetical protein